LGKEAWHVVHSCAQYETSLDLLRTLTLSLAAVAVVGIADVTPANAWYGAYGYWHPNHHYYRHAYWRHHWWCDHHPYACGYRRY
jgi:hypothetical protein